jgi:hypothetical protein
VRSHFGPILSARLPREQGYERKQDEPGYGLAVPLSLNDVQGEKERIGRKRAVEQEGEEVRPAESA